MSKRIPILGVQIDNVNHSQALEQVLNWLRGSGKHYVVTPNIEFIIKAQKDSEFKAILNKADLAIPDSARLNWAAYELKQTGFSKQFLSDNKHSFHPKLTFIIKIVYLFSF